MISGWSLWLKRSNLQAPPLPFLEQGLSQISGAFLIPSRRNKLKPKKKKSDVKLDCKKSRHIIVIVENNW